MNLLPFRNSAEALRDGLLLLQIHTAGDHDPLSLRRAGAVHRLRQVADGRRPQREVLDEAEDPHPVFRRDIGFAPAVFFQPAAGLRGKEILFGGEGDQKPAGNVLGEAGDLIGEADMKELVEMIAKALVDNPEQVVVTEVEGEQTTVLELRVAPTDLGKVIGKQGRTARCIRTLLGAAGMKLRKRFVLEILE